MEKSLARRSPQWLSIPERGSVLGIHLFVWAVTLGGRRVARALLWPVMLYFFLSSGRARRASRAFLQRVGHPAGMRDVFGHLLRFGQVALDRLLFVKGAARSMRFDLGPVELLEELRASPRGALLLGAHVGSFEALAGMARERELRVAAVVNTANSRMLMDVLERLDPTLGERLIDLGQDRLNAIFELRLRLERGEHVAVLADRCLAGERSVVVPFMGQDARFPAGPYVLAATLQCPVYFVAAIYRGGDRYEIHAERLAERITLPRRDREAALRKWATRYAERLEALARREPLNWFNFYEFWQLGE
jgi:predicted LPLAT superfamily acyltransferase